MAHSDPHRVIEAVLRDAWKYAPTPRLNKLYSDARRTWLEGRGVNEPLGRLMLDLLRETDEISPEDDAQLRLAYGVAA